LHLRLSSLAPERKPGFAATAARSSTVPVKAAILRGKELIRFDRREHWEKS
jgi:hypothetical protein